MYLLKQLVAKVVVVGPAIVVVVVIPGPGVVVVVVGEMTGGGAFPILHLIRQS